MSDGNDLDQRRTASRAAREKRKGLLRELRLEQQKKKDAETQKAKKPWYQVGVAFLNLGRPCLWHRR